MKLRFNVLGIEIASLSFDTEPGDTQTPVQVIEESGGKLLERVMTNPRVGKVIGRVSTAWVATGMQR